MIKKLKIGLMSLAVLAFVFAGANIASATVTYDVDTTIDLSSPDINLTILATSVATSVATGTGSVTAVVPNGSTFIITSANRSLSSDIATSTAFTINNACSGAQLQTMTLTGVSAGATVVITPGSAKCTTGGGGGGGGGGGSSSYVTPVVAIPATPAVPATQVEGCVAGQAFSTTNGKSCTVSATPAVPATPASIPGCGNGTSGFSTATGQSCAGNTGSVGKGSSVSSGPYNFGTTTLKNGSKGESVKELQRFLNKVLNLGLVVDGKLGPKTIAVIKKWQKDNGLVADGLVGKLTKGKMNASVQ